MSQKLGFEGLSATGSCLAAYSRSLAACPATEERSTANELSPNARQASFQSTLESTNRPTVVATAWNVALSYTTQLSDLARSKSKRHGVLQLSEYRPVRRANDLRFLESKRSSDGICTEAV
jgi:hypothetical protein